VVFVDEIGYESSVAIFVAFGWVIQAAEYLGLIETECQKPESIAHRRSFYGMSFIGTEVEGATCTEISPQSLTLRKGDTSWKLTLEENTLRGQGEFDLGPDGGVEFSVTPRGYLKVRVWASEEGHRHESEGAIQVEMEKEKSPAPAQERASPIG